ncbi:DUF1702 family protein [Nocardia colli]
MGSGVKRGARIPAVIRRRMMIPVRAMDFEVRGFRSTDPDLRARLEGVCSSLLAGYNPVMRYGVPEPLEEIEKLDPDMRGFAYEGAAIACAMLDVLTLSRGRNVPTLLSSPTAQHYPQLTAIGIGLGLAQLRKSGWGGLGEVDGLDPLVRWMAVDGRGFWGSFFHTTKYLATKRTAHPVQSLAEQVMDQGVGRSLWFVECADVPALGRRVSTFHPSRHADLWAGIGLAACYAGGADDAGLAQIIELSGEHRAQLAIGAATPSRARVLSGSIPVFAEQATKAFTGVDVKTAAGWETDAIREVGPHADTVADYLRMRELVRRSWLISTGGAVS